MPRAKKPEPLRPGDGQIAREEIEAYYIRQVDRARAELVAAQDRFDREQECAETALAKFRAGERLGEVDAWSIEVHGAGHTEIGVDILNGTSTDRVAYDHARVRAEAVCRWLLHEGYEPVEGARA